MAQVVDLAVQIMAEQGAGGLSLGELARRMGLRTPSLYGYFPSKNALYDAVFERGWTQLAVALAPERTALEETADLGELLLSLGRSFVGWFLDNPGFAQLMMWRPVPGYQPSQEAYRPAEHVLQDATAIFVRLQRRGLLRADVEPAYMLRVWTVVTSGVATQQMSNAPEQGLANGAFAATLPDVVAMFAQYFGAAAPVDQ